MTKKMIRKFIGCMVTCMFLVSSLTACGNKDQGQDAISYTITFMNGETTLGTATAKENSSLEATTYSAYETVEDAKFNGWYETPTFLESSKKDLATTTFTKDTILYGSFKSTQVAQDTRVWYIVGTSDKGSLKTSNWANSGVEESVRSQFQLTSTGAVTNEVAITMDLFKGDQFQIIHDWAWEDQKGYGCFTSIDDTQMENGGGLGGSSKTSNINVLMDGNYTVTLTTDPDNSAQDTLIIVRNGDPLTSPELVEEAPYMVSESTQLCVKGSWVADWSDIKELNRKDGTNTFTISMDLLAETELCFMVYDKGVDTGIVIKEENVVEEASLALLIQNGNNIKVAENGSYTFTVDLDTWSVVISK